MSFRPFAVLFASLAAMALGGCVATGSRHITIMHTNDMHGLTSLMGRAKMWVRSTNQPARRVAELNSAEANNAAV